MDTPRLTDREERTLESIRQQLDKDFPPWPDELVSALTGRRAARAGGPVPSRRRARAVVRTRRAATTLGVLALLISAVAGGAAARLVVQHLRVADGRSARDREVAPPSSGEAGPRRPVAEGSRGVSLAPGPPDSPAAPAPEAGDASARPSHVRPPAPAQEVELPPRQVTTGLVTSAPLPPAPPRSAVVPPTSAYYYAGRFFKHADGQWLAASRHDGPWEPVDADEVPSPLLALPGVYENMAEPDKDTTSSP